MLPDFFPEGERGRGDKGQNESVRDGALIKLHSIIDGFAGPWNIVSLIKSGHSLDSSSSSSPLFFSFFVTGKLSGGKSHLEKFSVNREDDWLKNWGILG